MGGKSFAVVPIVKRQQAGLIKLLPKKDLWSLCRSECEAKVAMSGAWSEEELNWKRKPTGYQNESVLDTVSHM